jgi:hypothetical protein
MKKEVGKALLIAEAVSQFRPPSFSLSHFS